MYIDARYVTTTTAMLLGSLFVIAEQKKEIKRLRAQSRRKDEVVGSYLRLINLLIDKADIDTIKHLLAGMEEEEEFLKIIANM